MSTITINNLKKEYDLNNVVLDGVSFAVGGGKSLTILGAPGSGKTTLLYCIGGLLDVSGGEILFDGELVNGIIPKNRNVALFAEGMLSGHKTVKANLAYGLKLRHTSKADINAAVESALKALGLSDKINTKVKNLSMYDRKRVALARVLVRKPFVFLLDEPLNGLTAEEKPLFAKQIKKINEHSQTPFIVCTDNGEDARLIGGDIAILHNGVIAQIGEYDIVKNSPTDIYCETILCNDINVLSVEKGYISANVNDFTLSPCSGAYEFEVTVKFCEDGVHYCQTQDEQNLMLITESFIQVGSVIKVYLDKTKVKHYDVDGNFISKK